MNIKNCLNCKKEPCDASTMANCIITQRGEWQITDSFFTELIEISKKYETLQASIDESKLLLHRKTNKNFSI
jgi:hypothetical protein